MWCNSELVTINVFIERRIDSSWDEIGHATVILDENQKIANWGDILIGTRNGKYTILNSNRPRPQNIEQYAMFRNLGVGTKAVMAVLDYFKRIGIKKIHGHIGPADDQIKTANFWTKLGFKVEKNKIHKEL